MVVKPLADATYYIEDCERGPIKAGGAGGSPPRTDRLPIMAYRKSRRAQSTEDAETWVDDGLANTLNQYDVGDVRTTHAVVSPTLTRYNLDSRSPQSEEQQRIVGAVHSVTQTVRRLTPLECERLMFFPDGWTDIPWRKKDTSPDSRRYAACGNAVVSSVSYWIGWRLAEVLNG